MVVPDLLVLLRHKADAQLKASFYMSTTCPPPRVENPSIPFCKLKMCVNNLMTPLHPANTVIWRERYKESMTECR